MVIMSFMPCYKSKANLREIRKLSTVFVRLCFNITNLSKVFYMLTHLVTDSNDYVQEILLGLKEERKMIKLSIVLSRTCPSDRGDKM